MTPEQLAEIEARATAAAPEDIPALIVEIRHLQVLLAFAEGPMPGRYAARLCGCDTVGLASMLQDAISAGMDQLKKEVDR